MGEQKAITKKLLGISKLLYPQYVAFYCVITCLVVIDLYLSATFFLEPYFSLFAGRQPYTKPFVPDFQFKPPHLSLQLVTTCGLSNSDHLDVFVSLLSNKTDGSCPSGFNDLETVPHPFLDGAVASCGLTQARSLNFIHFNPQYDGLDSSSYHGPRMRSTVMNSFEITLPDDIRQFQPDDAGLTVAIDLRLIDSDPCTTVSDCDDFLNSIIDSTQSTGNSFSVDTSSLACVSDPHSPAPLGCSVAVITGDPEVCQSSSSYIYQMFHIGEKYDGECAYTLAYEMYPEIPLILGGATAVWSWGGICFTSLLLVNVFLKFYYFRRLHLNFVSQYYFNKPPFNMKAGYSYVIKIYVTGDRFSKSEGVFRLYQGSKTIFEHDLSVEFEEEDRDGSGVDTICIRLAYKADADYATVAPSVSWDEDFHAAGNSSVMGEQMTCRRQFPWGIKNAMNIVCLPLYMPLLLFPKRARRLFSSVVAYLYLCLFLGATHCTYLLPLIFGVLAYVKVIPQLNFLFWHKGYESPPMVIAFYTLFVVNLVLPTCMGCLPISHRRNRGKSDFVGRLTFAQKQLKRLGGVPEAFIISAPPSAAVLNEYSNGSGLQGDYHRMRRVSLNEGMCMNELYQMDEGVVSIGPRIAGGSV
ncbi:hypothetical protein J8273_4370 [Carpediemonas membranifera]|uniref:Transmembrane protein n=1 Tax=Carpediemonas membranifera TaxID=201153 RepID=A0A8J6E251_9EUKA|nr:hypothetical protein J8273_4370 [Carpediemonas membranifera]|eukprot:KAG9394268.1 hypothetical protein J8273_4370 [Carpediemonas membranifera]